MPVIKLLHDTEDRVSSYSISSPSLSSPPPLPTPSPLPPSPPPSSPPPLPLSCRLEAVQTSEELSDVYTHFLLYYGRDLIAMQNSRSAGEEGGEKPKTTVKKALRRDFYSICQENGLGSLASKFGLTPEQFGENLRDNYQRHETEQHSIEPEEAAEDYVQHVGWVRCCVYFAVILITFYVFSPLLYHFPSPLPPILYHFPSPLPPSPHICYTCFSVDFLPQFGQFSRGRVTWWQCRLHVSLS